ncbi:hypothetical protein FRC09_003859 [Ceratobasidium sp. 395]|nr:hypothetical protein FRC09_003859 [Ceratobasidium sp. 395]
MALTRPQGSPESVVHHLDLAAVALALIRPLASSKLPRHVLAGGHARVLTRRPVSSKLEALRLSPAVVPPDLQLASLKSEDHAPDAANPDRRLVSSRRVDGEVKMTFDSLKKDTRPVPSAPSDPKGPGPMDVDSAGKGKSVMICNRCQGKGHMAKDCPSRPMSGYEASVEKVESESEESEKEDA